MRPDPIAASRQPAFRANQAGHQTLLLGGQGCRPPECRPKIQKGPACCHQERLYFRPVPLQKHPAIYYTVFWPAPDNLFLTESRHAKSMPIWPSYHRIRCCVLKMHWICSRRPQLFLLVSRFHKSSSKAFSIHCLPEICRHIGLNNPSHQGHCQRTRRKSGDISKKSQKVPFATVHLVAEVRRFCFSGQVKGHDESWPRLDVRFHWWCNVPSLHARLSVRIRESTKSRRLRSGDQSLWSQPPCVGSALTKMLGRHSRHWGMHLSFSFPENCNRQQGWKRTASRNNRCSGYIWSAHQSVCPSSIVRILLQEIGFLFFHPKDQSVLMQQEYRK